jgi:hypothetical protein
MTAVPVSVLVLANNKVVNAGRERGNNMICSSVIIRRMDSQLATLRDYPEQAQENQTALCKE